MDAMGIIFQGISFVNITGDSSNLSLSIISIMKKKKQEIILKDCRNTRQLFYTDSENPKTMEQEDDVQTESETLDSPVNNFTEKVIK